MLWQLGIGDEHAKPARLVASHGQLDEFLFLSPSSHNSDDFQIVEHESSSSFSSSPSSLSSPLTLSDPRLSRDFSSHEVVSVACADVGRTLLVTADGSLLLARGGFTLTANSPSNSPSPPSPSPCIITPSTCSSSPDSTASSSSSASSSFISLQLHATPPRCAHGLPASSGRRIRASSAACGSSDVVIYDTDGCLWSFELSSLRIDDDEQETVVFLRRITHPNQQCVQLLAGRDFFLALVSIPKPDRPSSSSEEGEEEGADDVFLSSTRREEGGEEEEEEGREISGSQNGCRQCAEKSRMRLSALMLEADRAAEAASASRTSSVNVRHLAPPSMRTSVDSAPQRMADEMASGHVDIDDAVSMRVHRALSMIALPLGASSSCGTPSNSSGTALATAASTSVAETEDAWLAASSSSARHARLALLAWGDNARGQLGHGDNINRATPAAVSFFDRIRVCKMAAGHRHAVALSSAGTAYFWGASLMSGGEKGALSPQVLKVGCDSLVLDVTAAADAFAVLVVDKDAKTNVLVAAAKKSIVRLTTVPKEWTCASLRLSDTCDSILLRTADDKESRSLPVWRAAAQFAQLITQLEELGKHCLQERIKKTPSSRDSDASSSSTECCQLLRRLNGTLAKFAAVAAINAEFVRDRMLSSLARGASSCQGSPDSDSSPASLYEMANSTRFRRAFRRYCDAYVSARAFRAFDQLTFSTDSAKKYVETFSLANEVSSPKPESVIRKLFALPIQRLESANKAFDDAARQVSDSDGSSPSGFASLWRRILAEADETFAAAQATADFWTRNPQQQDLRAPDRLLVACYSLNSASRRLRSISTSQSSLLSPKYTHICVFNDVVVFGTKSTSQRYPARLLWLQRQGEEGRRQIGDLPPTSSIACQTPEETFYVEFEDEAAMAHFRRACAFWHWCGFQGTPAATVSPSSTTVEKKSSEDQIVVADAADRPPDLRIAQLQFTCVTPIVTLREAFYEGEWKAARPHGRGKIFYKDGRVYEGDFEDALPHGFGILHQPAEAEASGTPSSSFFYVASAMPTSSSLRSGSFSAGLINEYRGRFVLGAPHGLVHIRFASGDVYRGYVRGGQPDGFGWMQSQRENYIGFYSDGKRHGYGVHSQLTPTGTIRSKYFGEFVNGVECGRGTLVDRLGAYHEGTFKDGVIKKGYLQCPPALEERGARGVPPFPYEYVGEFDGYGYASGIGALHVSPSLRISGRFNAVLVTADGDICEQRKKPEEIDITEGRLEPVRPPLGGGGARSDGPIECSRVVPIDCRWTPLFELFVLEEMQVREWRQPAPPSPAVASVRGALDEDDGIEMLTRERREQQTRVAWRAIADAVCRGSAIDGRGQSVSDDVVLQFDQSGLAFRAWSAGYHVTVARTWNDALKTMHHPLTRIARTAVDVFLTTYGGPQHRCMYDQAVLELAQLISHLYDVVRLLFPSLPPDPLAALPSGREARLSRASCRDDSSIGGDDAEEVTEAFMEGEEDDVTTLATSEGDRLPSHFSSETTSPARSSRNSDELSSLLPAALAGDFLYDFFFYEVYSCLSPLYLISTAEQDRLYWDRIVFYNAHTDVQLLKLLDVHQSIWPIELENPDDLSATVIRNSARFKYYESAIKTLQNITSESNPFAKLIILIETFIEIDHCKASFSEAGRSHQWSCDSLMPAFIYVVVRARIQHLGAEIRLIGDFTRRTHEGAVSYMFTNLEAAYNFICCQNIL